MAGGANAAGIPATEGIVVDDSGNVYIGGQTCGKVRKIDIGGRIERIAGNVNGGYFGDGGDPLLAVFGGPAGVAIGKKGEIYIADEANQRIRCIGCKSSSGIGRLENPSTDFLIEPNPSCGRFDVKIEGSEFQQHIAVTICDVTGRIIETRKAETQSEHFNLKVKPGLYFITATLHNQSYTQQLIIE